MSSATKLSRVDMLSHSIKDYVGLTNLEGTMDATIRVNHSMTAKTRWRKFDEEWDIYIMSKLSS